MVVGDCDQETSELESGGGGGLGDGIGLGDRIRDRVLTLVFG